MTEKKRERAFDRSDLRRLEALKRGSENAPPGYVNIKRDDVLWLIGFASSRWFGMTLEALYDFGCDAVGGYEFEDADGVLGWLGPVP